MERLIMLGSGAAFSMRCYNSCFALQDKDEYLLVDGGGGNGIFRQADAAGVPLENSLNTLLWSRTITLMLSTDS